MYHALSAEIATEPYSEVRNPKHEKTRPQATMSRRSFVYLMLVVMRAISIPITPQLMPGQRCNCGIEPTTSSTCPTLWAIASLISFLNVPRSLKPSKLLNHHLFLKFQWNLSFIIITGVVAYLEIVYFTIFFQKHLLMWNEFMSENASRKKYLESIIYSSV